MYIPLYNEVKRRYFFKFSVTKLCFITVSLPLFAFITCVLMTMYKDFQNANNTHCNVPNIFPSISASIGNYEPQSSIWRTAIYAHAPMRFFIIYLRWEYYRSVISENLDIVIKLAVFLNVIENLALIGLSHWTSSLHYLTKLCFITVSLPLFAFITCVLMTMYKDFQNANNTHCNVPNIFPSISASIGNYEPQSSIWRTAIYAHAPMRFFIIYLRWEYYRSVISENLDIVIKLAVFLNVIENLALIGLSHWTSSLHYPYHELCFKTFIGTSVFYMLFTCMMLTKYRRKSSISSSEAHSIKLKWRAFYVNICSFAFAAYFFLRHNSLCEPYVYSLFGFSEYIVVISNIMFHLTTVYDLRRQFLCVSLRGIYLE